jgi:hypothetical protein
LNINVVSCLVWRIFDWWEWRRFDNEYFPIVEF